MRILFVCLGNICRSPTAEAVARARGIDCDSAGTAGWHVGKAPYAPMQEAASARGYTMSDLRARQLTRADFEAFDLIIVMDDDNAADAERLRPPGNTTPLRNLTEYDPTGAAPGGHVPDPYYTRDFDGALTLIERCIDGLAAQALR
ncbi:MAG: low molecular weight protein-tyrosine-phosphatase [Pseudomonadota bacterium]